MKTVQLGSVSAVLQKAILNAIDKVGEGCVVRVEVLPVDDGDSWLGPPRVLAVVVHGPGVQGCGGAVLAEPGTRTRSATRTKAPTKSSHHRLSNRCLGVAFHPDSFHFVCHIYSSNLVTPYRNMRP